MGSSWLPRFMGRIVAAALVVVVVWVVIKLVLMTLEAILPGPVMALLGQGGGLLYQVMAPALPPLIALGLLLFIIWLVLDRAGR